MEHSGHREHKHLCGNVRNVVMILEPERLFQNQKRLLFLPTHPPLAAHQNSEVAS